MTEDSIFVDAQQFFAEICKPKIDCHARNAYETEFDEFKKQE
jgi:hypothetical protein